ncbi:MAG: 1-acyl-sn-glycerol-3-phosphate acyltransferase [Gammaproteobacteria bacterium]|nr:1-acyl-sn-glycerol-3-phosphate acyltransferase [Gammaproteobacteria bacterium]
MEKNQSGVGPLYKFWLTLRGSLFWIVFLPSVLVCALLLSMAIIFPITFRIAIIKSWIVLNLAWIELTCGLGYEVEGLENIPEHGFIVMSKHSSTWETIALQRFFGPMVWVVKKELTYIPFFGWGLKALNAIAINRGTGRKAIKQLIEDGRRRMDEGRIVMLFPEGTRVMPGQHKPFKLGGAILAEKTGYSILPIAHNAGEYWPRHSWIKWPGTIKVVIGKPIDPEGKKPHEIIQLVEQWITETGEQISDKEQLKRLGINSA